MYTNRNSNYPITTSTTDVFAMAALPTPGRSLDIDDFQTRDTIKWYQAQYHANVTRMRNGITEEPPDENIAILLDDREPQPWRIPPPNGARRTIPPLDQDDQDVFRDFLAPSPDRPSWWAIQRTRQSPRNISSDHTRRRGRVLTNRIARRLYKFVSITI